LDVRERFASELLAPRVMAVYDGLLGLQ
jgi:hypothetical protein